MRTLRLNRTCGVWFWLQALIYKAPQKEPLRDASPLLSSLALYHEGLARRGEQQQQSPPPRGLCVTKAPLECPQDTPKEPCSGPLEWGARWLGIARAGDGRGGVEAGARRCSEQVSSEHLGGLQTAASLFESPIPLNPRGIPG